MVIERGTTLKGREFVLPGGRSPSASNRIVPRGRHGRPREEIESIQRARILDAFVTVVGRRGLKDAHVGAVCTEAGVSTKEFYAIFESKEKCLFAAFDLGIEVVCEEGTRVYEQTEGLWEARVKAALAAMLSALGANPAFARLCLVEMASAGPAGIDRLNSMIRHCREIFRADEVPARPPELSEDEFIDSLIGSVLGPVMKCVRSGRADQLLELVPALIYSIALPIVGRERALRQLHGWSPL